MWSLFQAVFKKQKPQTDVRLNFLEHISQSLLALQGPKAADALQKLTDVDLSNFYFMNSRMGEVAGIKNCRLTRYNNYNIFKI